MRVFITGATGFIGSALVADLLAAGHQMLGLTRSKRGRKRSAAGARALSLAALEDLEGLQAGRCAGRRVVHLAFNHDFSTYLANCEDDRRVIMALGSALAGFDRPLLVTSGTGMAAPGRPATEDDPPASSAAIPRSAVGRSGGALAAEGVNAGVVRLPQVHDAERQGLITYAVTVAREKGVSAYVGDGSDRWAAAHRLDTARLYRLALERAERAPAITRSPRKAFPCARCRSHRPTPRPARGLRSRRSRWTPTSAGWACSSRRDGEASSALTTRTAGMAADRPWADRRSGRTGDRRRLEGRGRAAWRRPLPFW